MMKVFIYRPDSIAMGLAAVTFGRRCPGTWARLRVPTAA
jgi:hypothetical protein